MKLNVHRVDSCILSDGQSMFNIISLLNSKNVLIINGDERENQIIEVVLFCFNFILNKILNVQFLVGFP